MAILLSETIFRTLFTLVFLAELGGGLIKLRDAKLHHIIILVFVGVLLVEGRGPARGSHEAFGGDGQSVEGVVWL